MESSSIPDFLHFPSDAIDRIEADARRAQAYQYLSNLDEELTVWDTTLEYDAGSGTVNRGRNLFEWVSFVERLDAEIQAEVSVTSRGLRSSPIITDAP